MRTREGELDIFRGWSWEVCEFRLHHSHVYIPYTLLVYLLLSYLTNEFICNQPTYRYNSNIYFDLIPTDDPDFQSAPSVTDDTDDEVPLAQRLAQLHRVGANNAGTTSSNPRTKGVVGDAGGDPSTKRKNCPDVCADVERKVEIIKKTKHSRFTKSNKFEMIAQRRADLPALKTRTSPKQLVEFLATITGAQVRAIKEIGFGSILDLRVKIIPGAIGYYLVEHFDVVSMSLNLHIGKESLHITDREVHDTLGIPIGHDKVTWDVGPVDKSTGQDA
jgi:hypothetical protein